MRRRHVVLSMTSAVAASTVMVACTASNAPGFSLHPIYGAAGSSVSYESTNCLRGVIDWRQPDGNAIRLADIFANSQGSYAGHFIAPSSAQPGPATVTLNCDTRSASVTFLVTSASAR